MEREHSRAFPERIGCDGQQQLPGELWRGRERGKGGVGPRGTSTLQVPLSAHTFIQFLS